MTTGSKDGRQLLRELQPRQAGVRLESALGVDQQTYPSIFEDTAFIRFIKGLEIRHNTPEERLSELDQTDPAGRYRIGVTADSFVMARSQAAGWANALGSATDFDFLVYDRSNTLYALDAYESNAWYVRILAGAAATPQTNSRVTVGGSTSASTGIRLNTGDGIGTVVERIAVLMGAATVDIDISNARMDFNGNAVAGLASTRGNGTADLNIIANKVATDATARRIALWVLDPATDTEYAVAQAVPNAANALFTMRAPDAAPGTAQLDASNITLRYTPAGAVTLYVNDAGVVKSLSLGTPV